MLTIDHIQERETQSQATFKKMIIKLTWESEKIRELSYMESRSLITRCMTELNSISSKKASLQCGTGQVL